MYPHNKPFFLSALMASTGMSEEHGCSGTLPQLHIKLHGNGRPDPAWLWGGAGDRSKEVIHSGTAASGGVMALGTDCDFPLCHRKRQETPGEPGARLACSRRAQQRLFTARPLPTSAAAGPLSILCPSRVQARHPGRLLPEPQRAECSQTQPTWTPVPFPAQGSHCSSFHNGTE